jgi:hypothetical protein
MKSSGHYVDSRVLGSKTLNFLQMMYLYIQYISPNQHWCFPVEYSSIDVSNGSAVFCELRSDFFLCKMWSHFSLQSVRIINIITLVYRYMYERNC